MCDHSACENTNEPTGERGEFAECTVMPGSKVLIARAEVAGLYRDHQGHRYWLCCNSCGEKFDANPSLYIAA